MSKINFESLVKTTLLESFSGGQQFGNILRTALNSLGDPAPDKNVIKYAQEALNMFLQKGGQAYISDERLATERTAWPVIDIITYMLENFYTFYPEGPVVKKRPFKIEDLNITQENIKNIITDPAAQENIINTVTAFSANPRNHIIQYSPRLKKLDSDIDIRVQKIEPYLNDTPINGIVNYYKNIKSKLLNDVISIMNFPLDYSRIEVNPDLQAVKNLSQTLLEFYRQNVIRVYGDVSKFKIASGDESPLPSESEFVDILKNTAGSKRGSKEKFHLDYIQFLNGNSEFLVNIEAPGKYEDVDKVLTKLGIPGYEPVATDERYPPPFIQKINDFNSKTFLVGATKVFEAYLIAIDIVKGPKTQGWDIVKRGLKAIGSLGVVMGPVN